jgi:WhiB family redox-sensing transcriptional regulator
MSYRDGLDWRAAGACLTADPDLFFPLSASGAAAPQVDRARRICAGCRVLRQCLDFAMAHAEVDGIWGGTTQPERVHARRTDGSPQRAERFSRPRRRAA